MKCAPSAFTHGRAAGAAARRNGAVILQDRWAFVATTGTIAPGQCAAFEIGEHALLVCHAGGSFHALENRCSHAGAPLAGGRLRGFRLVCPLHGAAFDVRDGSATGKPATRPLRTYPLRVRDDRIEVELPDK
jgi:3-phenylpropionate/trans-cinnamate dioxygenase ferredoxin subunit